MRGAPGRWSGKVLNAQLGRMKYLSCEQAGSVLGCRRVAPRWGQQGCGFCPYGGQLGGVKPGLPCPGMQPCPCSISNSAPSSLGVVTREGMSVAAPYAQTAPGGPNWYIFPPKAARYGVSLWHYLPSSLPTGRDRAATSQVAGSRGSTLGVPHPSSPPNPSTTPSPRPSGTPSR